MSCGVDVNTSVQALLVDGSRAMTGNLDMGGNDIVNVGTVDGVDVSNHGARHAAAGADPLQLAATDRLLGRFTAGAGNVEELTVAQVAAWVEGSIDHGALIGLGDDDHPQYLLADGTRSMSGSLNMGTNAITGVTTLALGGVTQTKGLADGTTQGAIAYWDTGSGAWIEETGITRSGAGALTLTGALAAGSGAITGGLTVGGTGQFEGQVTIDNNGVALALDGIGTNDLRHDFYAGGVLRWSTGRRNAANNTNFFIRRYNGSGVLQEAPIEVRGTDGAVLMPVRAGASTSRIPVVWCTDLDAADDVTAGGDGTFGGNLTLGDFTGSPTMTVRSDDAGQFNLFLYKDSHGAGDTGAHRVVHDAAENLLVRHGDGVGGWTTSVLWAPDGALRLGASGGALGFYQGVPVTKQTVTGSRGGNAALASLLTALANLGLVTDSSS